MIALFLSKIVTDTIVLPNRSWVSMGLTDTESASSSGFEYTYICNIRWFGEVDRFPSL